MPYEKGQGRVMTRSGQSRTAAAGGRRRGVVHDQPGVPACRGAGAGGRLGFRGRLLHQGRAGEPGSAGIQDSPRAGDAVGVERAYGQGQGVRGGRRPGERAARVQEGAGICAEQCPGLAPAIRARAGAPRARRSQSCAGEDRRDARAGAPPDRSADAQPDLEGSHFASSRAGRDRAGHAERHRRYALASTSWSNRARSGSSGSPPT